MNRLPTDREVSTLIKALSMFAERIEDNADRLEANNHHLYLANYAIANLCAVLVQSEANPSVISEYVAALEGFAIKHGLSTEPEVN